MVWVFALCAFFYVMIEQSFGTWLPTFHQQVFGLTPAAAAGLLSLYAGSIAAGRFVFGAVALRVPWVWLLLALLLAAIAVTGIIVSTTGGEPPAPVEAWTQAPIAAFALSALGLFLGPIYPTIVSAVLGRLEPSRHSAMTGLIIVFSALGGATGSFIVGVLSRGFSTHDAFYFPLVPMALLVALLVPFDRLIKAAPAPGGGGPS
jgi:fucose permease